VAAPLLLLVARDLLLYDPPRVLAWRLLHEARLSDLPAWLRTFVSGGGAFDRDPLALLLAAGCSAAAVALLVCGLAGARARVRAIWLGLGALYAVIVPTVSLIAMGWAMDRPYGQDGGVVQLPLALDLLLQGRSPYGADYSASILGRQARVSPFWQAYGGNPLLHHHAYLPGTHLLMLPGYLVAKALGLAFDPRLVTLLALAAASWLAARLVRPVLGAEGALAAAAVVLVNPLVYWPFAFGANDVLQVALLLAAVALAARGRALWCGAVLGLACASKQLAWPYAPFLLAHLAGARTLRELLAPASLRRMALPALAALAVFVAVVVPVLALDPRGFWGDIVVYNVGLPGSDSYPLGGTPGFGLANFLVYFGRVASLRDHVSFAPFYAVLLPLCVLLLRRQLRERHPAAALVTGSAALLASVYVSRVAHPNYLVFAAILLPVGWLALPRDGAPRPASARSWGADAVVAPLLLFALAVELVEHEPLRALWEDAVAARLPAHASGLTALLLPRAGPALTLDPLGYLFAALAAGLGVVWILAALLGASARVRLALGAVAVAAVVLAPAIVIARVGAATGTPRAQEPWMVPVSDEARRAAGQTQPAPVREAMSMSFRRDPPSVLAEGYTGSPPQRALGRLLGALGRTDPRPLMALALALAAALLARRALPEQRPMVLAAAALAPPAAMGTIMGSPIALALLVAALAWRPWRSRTQALLTLTAAAALIGLSSLAVAGTRTDLPAFQPGLGLTNVFLYAGLTVPMWPLWIAVAAVLAFAVVRVLRSPTPLLEAAAFTTLFLWLAPGVSPNTVALPIVLLLVSALRDPPAPLAAAQPEPPL
jgi:glycosyl transferase family 87